MLNQFFRNTRKELDDKITSLKIQGLQESFEKEKRRVNFINFKQEWKKSDMHKIHKLIHPKESEQEYYEIIYEILWDIFLNESTTFDYKIMLIFTFFIINRTSKNKYPIVLSQSCLEKLTKFLDELV